MNDTVKKLGENEWVHAHAEGYQQNVYSVTHEPMLCDTIANKVTQFFPNAARILVPGCGSVGLFEQRLAQRQTNDTILCTDYKGVIAHAPKTNNQKIHYAAYDSLALPFYANFDVVVPINAVLDSCDEKNITMLKRFHQSLEPNGMMIGLFPTIFCALDIHINTTNAELKEDMKVDLENSKGLGPREEAEQIFYTPGALRQRLLDTGFTDIGMEIVFFDTPYFKEEAKRLYKIQEDDVPVYEFLVTAKKPPRP